MKLIVRSTLLLAQFLVASFYAIAAVLMWGPFVAGPFANKLIVAAVILWPLIGFTVAASGVPGNRLGVTGALGLLTVLQALIVLAAVTLL